MHPPVTVSESAMPNNLSEALVAPAPASGAAAGMIRVFNRLRSFIGLGRRGAKVPPAAPEGGPQQPRDLGVVADEEPAVPKKVGVLTLPLHTNYGGNLQAFALMTVLRRLGHDPVLINRKHAGSPDAAGTAWSPDTPLTTSTYARGKKGPSYDFIDRRIAPFTRPFRSTAELTENIARYDFDAIIVGSDQVWRAKYTRALLPNYFLDFLAQDAGQIRRISYAASFGADTWEYAPPQAEAAKELIARFDAVSVREDSAVDLCRHHLDVAATHVLDPTLLLRAEDYLPLFTAEREESAGGGLLGYILDRSPDKLRLIDTLSKTLGVTAHSVDGRPFAAVVPADDDADRDEASVERWLASFHDAAFVVTDSFHGAAFSILFNKPFVAYGNPSRGLARFTSLLRMFGLEDRLVVDSAGIDSAAVLRPIDWPGVNARLAAARVTSLAFLRSALSEERAAREGAAAPPVPIAAPAKRAPSVSDGTSPLGTLCSGCGVCVSESGGSLRMAWNEDGFLVPRATGDVVPAAAVRVCPFNPAPEPAVQDEDALAKIFLPGASRFDAGAGRFENAYVGYSRTFRPTSSSGGVATFVFEQLLRRGDVDSLFVVRSDGAGGYGYQLFDDADRIAEVSKTRYYPVTMEALFAAIAGTPGRVAVSGVACFIKAIRLKQFYHPELRDKIPFLVGIVCGGLKSRGYTEFLAQSAGITGAFTTPDYRVKNPQGSAMDYSFAATDARSRTRAVRMRRLGDMWGTGLFKARACDFCTDVLTELADISLGDAWLPEYKTDGMGNSIVVTRTALADEIVRRGIASAELVAEPVPITRINQSQGGGFSHKQNAISVRVAMAERFSDVPVPAIRDRLMRTVAAPQALVQVHRERTRWKSLRYWRESGDAPRFLRRMRSSLEMLKTATAARRDTSADSLTTLLTGGQLDRVRAVASGTGADRLTARWLLDKIRRRQIDVEHLPGSQRRAHPADRFQSVDTPGPPG